MWGLVPPLETAPDRLQQIQSLSPKSYDPAVKLSPGAVYGVAPARACLLSR